MQKTKPSRVILVGVTGQKERDWRNKLGEIEKFKITEVALFLECFDKEQRKKIYNALLTSKIKSIPLVHIRNDMTVDELKFLKQNFKIRYFTIHEENFARGDIKKWKGFYKNLCLEMNFDNIVSDKVSVKKIDGFCVDLAHFKVALEKLSKDFEYVFKRREIRKYFDCNHVNGWNPKTNCDMHTINGRKDFDYLKTLPKFLFGKIIAIEAFNPIKKQLEFKKYLADLLSKKK